MDVFSPCVQNQEMFTTSTPCVYTTEMNMLAMLQGDSTCWRRRNIREAYVILFPWTSGLQPSGVVPFQLLQTQDMYTPITILIHFSNLFTIRQSLACTPRFHITCYIVERYANYVERSNPLTCTCFTWRPFEDGKICGVTLFLWIVCVCLCTYSAITIVMVFRAHIMLFVHRS